MNIHDIKDGKNLEMSDFCSTFAEDFGTRRFSAVLGEGERNVIVR